MEENTFIDKYFQSQKNLLDFRFSGSRDIVTLTTFLECLHTVGDRLKKGFECDITKFPEFKLLRIVRNYLHHVGDVDDIRLFVSISSKMVVSYGEHLIIPMDTFAKSVQSFIGVTREDVNKGKKQSIYVENELLSILDCCECGVVFNNPSDYCSGHKVKLDGQIYSLGFDLFKFVYNITNIIADKCRTIDSLSGKKVITDLDRFYAESNNIARRCVLVHPNDANFFLTTKGYVFYEKLEIVR